VTKLLQQLHDELVRRHYAGSTIQSYLMIVDLRCRSARTRERSNTQCVKALRRRFPL
jgi:hypothetical protein